MEVIPAIDLVEGQVVRLVQGRFDAATTFARSAEELSDSFAAQGARWLHVVDLDAARLGRRPPAHEALLRRLVDRKAGSIQVGGGFRTADDVDEALATGIDRVLVGTLAVREPETFAGLVAHHGERICLTADALAGSVRIAGWEEDSGEPVAALVRDWSARGVGCFLVTAIERDGTLAGPDLSLLADVRAATDATLIASGGIGTLDDVRRVAEVGCDAVVVGRALLTGAIDLAAAIAVAGGRGTEAG
jgi:phosphoribosylformimino-5-aminoimidazole carboxamide ribotide isomerase